MKDNAERIATAVEGIAFALMVGAWCAVIVSIVYVARNF